MTWGGMVQSPIDRLSGLGGCTTVLQSPLAVGMDIWPADWPPHSIGNASECRRRVLKATVKSGAENKITAPQCR